MEALLQMGRAEAGRPRRDLRVGTCRAGRFQMPPREESRDAKIPTMDVSQPTFFVPLMFRRRAVTIISFVRLSARLRGIDRSTLRLDELLVDGKLFLTLFFPSRARVGSREIVVRVGIPRLEFNRGLQRWDGIGISLERHQRNAEAEEGLGEMRIEFCRAREMRDRIIPELILARQLSQHIFGPSVRGIDCQLFLEFMLRVVCQAGRGIWLREHKPSQPEVNAWEVGILLNNLAI